ncbi:MAG: WG repeat-containing protein [Planctomycetes bacterium]|nr:WG repeat-containing protein [Planctomycetota bacterium]
MMRHSAMLHGFILALTLLCAGCGETELSDSDKWWLTPPKTATRVVFEKNGKWGYRDLSGKVVIPPRFDRADSFPGEGNVLMQNREKSVHVRLPSKPLGRVMLDGKWGYIDLDGNIVIPPQYDMAMDFFEDLTAVKVGKKWGYIDTKGKMVISPRYDEASPFLLGVAHVRKGEKWMIINNDGKSTAGKQER